MVLIFLYFLLFTYINMTLFPVSSLVYSFNLLPETSWHLDNYVPYCMCISLVYRPTSQVWGGESTRALVNNAYLNIFL